MTFRVKLRVKTLKPWPIPALYEPQPIASKCGVCGMAFTDALGRPIAMGYACGNLRCPSGARSGAYPPTRQRQTFTGGTTIALADPNIRSWN